MKQIILVLIILLNQDVFGWNAHRNSEFNRDLIRKDAGTRERPALWTERVSEEQGIPD